jgi:hypothetical protein
MSDDETDIEIEEGYDEFIKEYGSRYEWDNEGIPEFTPEWQGWEDLFCEIKIYWKTKAIRCWREKILKRFVYSLPNIRNPTSLFHVFIQSNAFYLPQILSLIELPYSAEELRWEIWPDGIDTDEIKIGNNANEIEMFRYGILRQDKDSIADYYSKVKRCNDIVNFSEERLRNEFIEGLTLENQWYIAMSGYYRTLDELVKELIQAERQADRKEAIPVFTAFSEYCRQAGITNQNLIQSIWRSSPSAMHWLVRGR